MRLRLFLATLAAALLAAALFTLSSCGKRGSGDEIVIGEYGSLTGTTATFGQSTDNGIQMAFDEINKAGGVLGKKVKIIVEDDQSKPEEAKTSVLKLIKQDHVVALIGEIASSRTLAAAPEAQRSKVPLITPGSANPEVTAKGDYIFRICFIDPVQGQVMARFAAQDLKLMKAAILTDVKNDYSVGLAKYFKEEYEKLGGKVVAEVPRATKADVDRAVKAAAAAFPAWRNVAPRDRGRILQRIAEDVEARIDDLARTLATETGNAIRTQARPEAKSVADVFRYFGGLGGELKGETIPLGEHVLSYTRREPLGVVAAIVPWNVPILIAAWKIAPALLAGNTVVRTPSANAPLAVLAALLAGLPPAAKMARTLPTQALRDE
jgi:hypothetical protein